MKPKGPPFHSSTITAKYRGKKRVQHHYTHSMYQNKAISVIVLLMLVYAGQAKAGFRHCFGRCILGCVLKPDHTVCASKCLVKCVVLDSPPSQKLKCKLGCGIKHCVPFGKDVHKVSDCVKSCESEKCGKVSSAELGPSSNPNCQVDCGINQCFQVGEDPYKVGDCVVNCEVEKCGGVASSPPEQSPPPEDA